MKVKDFGYIDFWEYSEIFELIKEQEAMAHKTLMMTSWYVHHNVDSLRHAVEGLPNSTKLAQSGVANP